MTIQQFIEKAIKGGWEDKAYRTIHYGESAWSHFDSLFLDPEAWKAVGKIMGWVNGSIEPCDCEGTKDGECLYKGEDWLRLMHRMVDALAEGESIEQFIETL